MKKDLGWRQAIASPGWSAMVRMAAAAALLAGAYAAVSLALPHTGIAAIVWLPNALVVALILSGDRACFPAALVGTAVGLGFGAIVSGIPVGVAFARICLNLSEIAIVVVLVLDWDGEKIDFTEPRAFFGFVAASLIAVSVSASVGVLGRIGQAFDMATGILLFVRNFSGLLFLTPVAMIAMAAWKRRSEESVLVPVPVLAVVAGGLLAIFAQSDLPLLFLVPPLVALAAISSGLGGAAFALVLAAAIATGATVLGIGPIALAPGGSFFQFALLQLFLASLVFVALPLAGLVERGMRDREALRISREEKRRVLDNIDEVIFCIDNAGTWTSLNTPWERITGRRCEDSIGQPFDRFLPDAERDRIGVEMSRLRAGLVQVAELELSFERPDGEARQVEMRMRLAHDRAGRVTGVVGHMVDISDKAAGRKALQASEQQFATLADLAPAGLFRANARGEYTWVNPAWRAVTGLSDGKWQGSGWADAIHPDDFDRVYYGWGAAVAAKERFEEEWRWRRPNGTIAWVRSLAAPQFDSDGRLTGFVGINMDITGPREAENRIAQRDRMLQLIADNVRDALFMVTQDGRCSYASPFAGAMFGIAPDDLCGRPFASLFGMEAAKDIDRRLRPLWAGDEASCEFRFRVSGKGAAPAFARAEAWMDAHFSVARRSDGIEGIVASVRDISGVKRLEADLTRARQEAERAAQAKGEVLADISREIRTPMDGVIGFADLLVASDLAGAPRRHAQLIAESGRAVMQLLDDVLDMSRSAWGMLAIKPVPVDPRLQIDACIDLLRPVAGCKGLALRAEVDPEVPGRLITDPLRLREILQTLIGNAVHYTDRGEVVVAARVEVGHDGADRLAIDVADTGCGIPPERLAEIFGRLRAGEAPKDDRRDGAGLGLAISNRLARLMGGEISGWATVGVGTTFTIRIPLRVAEDRHDAPASGATDGSAMPQLAGDPPRVLIAEDHDVSQELIVAMARQIGLDPDLAWEGSEAIRMVEVAQRSGRPYRLVLMDMDMPGMDGLEATRLLRAAGYEPDMLPILALSASCSTEHVAACRQAGMQGHLAKPLQLDAFQAIAVRHFGLPDKPLSNAGIDDDLSARYRESKQTLLRELADVAGGKGTPQWDVLAMQLHKLAGTAGLFGDSDLGERARVLEDRLRSAKGPEERTELVRSEWERLGNAA